MFKHAVYIRVGCAELKSIGYRVNLLSDFGDFRIHIETGLRYSAFGEILSKVYDCINRFFGEQLSRCNGCAERIDYRIEFDISYVFAYSLYSRGREEHRNLFEYKVNPIFGSAEFKSVGNRVEFSCYLCDFRIHIEAGLRYSTLCEVLSQIYNRIDRFTREQFGCFEYFSRRTDYRVEFENFRIVYESLNRRGREQYGYLFKYTFNVCGSCTEFKPVGYRIEFSCYLGNFRIHIETGLRYSAFGEVLSKVYDCINSFFGE